MQLGIAASKHPALLFASRLKWMIHYAVLSGLCDISQLLLGKVSPPESVQ